MYLFIFVPTYILIIDVYVCISIHLSKYLALYIPWYQVNKIDDPTNSFPTHAKVFLAYTSQG